MTETVLLQGFCLLIVLGIMAQWIAWRVRVPAILLLLAFGAIAGPASLSVFGHKFFDPDLLLGPLLQPIVALSVAIILFEGGLTLNISELTQVGGVVRNLVTIGAAATWLVISLAGWFVLGLPWQLAVLLGAILVVTGPTVVGPLLRHVRPVGRVAAALKWEGIIIDPVGAILAVLIFDAVRTGHVLSKATAWLVAVTVFKTALVGLGIGLAAAFLLILLLRRFLIADYLQNPFTLMLVIAAYTGAEQVQPDSGLLAVTVMGITLANQRAVPFKHILEFKESLSVLLVSALFVLLSARLELGQIAHLSWRTVGFVAALFLIGRPAAVALSTIRSGFTWQEKLFMAAVAPRGIVAAAVAGVFALRLRSANYADADRLVPITFVVIIATVIVYGLSAAPLARWLKLARPGQAGFLIVGANRVGLTVAAALRDANQQVILADTSAVNVSAAKAAGFTAFRQSVLSERMMEQTEGTGIGHLLALTPNEEVNVLAAVHFARQFGRSCVYQLAPVEPPKRKHDRVSHELSGRVLFQPKLTFDKLQATINAGTVHQIKFTAEFGQEQYAAKYGDRALPLFLLSDTGECQMVTADDPPVPRAGQTLFAIAEVQTVQVRQKTSDEAITVTE
jgi:NhaP-type Na+/H+ or K+/H+ antiporter